MKKNRNAQSMVTTGYKIGEMKRDKFIPDHGWYQWRGHNPKEKVQLGYDQSISHLQCRDVKGSFQDRGKVSVRFEGFNLGQGKEEKSRIVSKYPRPYRIRMERPESYQKIVESLARSA